MQASQLAGVFVQYFPTVARCGCAVLHFKAVAPKTGKTAARQLFHSHGRKEKYNRRITCIYSRIRSAVVSGNIITAVEIAIFYNVIKSNIAVCMARKTDTRHEIGKAFYNRSGIPGKLNARSQQKQP